MLEISVPITTDWFTVPSIKLSTPAPPLINPVMLSIKVRLKSSAWLPPVSLSKLTKLTSLIVPSFITPWSVVFINQVLSILLAVKVLLPVPVTVSMPEISVPITTDWFTVLSVKVSSPKPPLINPVMLSIKVRVKSSTWLPPVSLSKLTKLTSFAVPLLITPWSVVFINQVLSILLAIKVLLPMPVSVSMLEISVPISTVWFTVLSVKVSSPMPPLINPVILFIKAKVKSSTWLPPVRFAKPINLSVSSTVV